MGAVCLCVCCVVGLWRVPVVVGFMPVGFLLLVAMVLALHVLAVPVLSVLVLGVVVLASVSALIRFLDLCVSSCCLGVCGVVCGPSFCFMVFLDWLHFCRLFLLAAMVLALLVMAVTGLSLVVLVVLVLALVLASVCSLCWQLWCLLWCWVWCFLCWCWCFVCWPPCSFGWLPCCWLSLVGCDGVGSACACCYCAQVFFCFEKQVCVKSRQHECEDVCVCVCSGVYNM